LSGVVNILISSSVEGPPTN